MKCENENSYMFKNLPGSFRKVLVCPACAELLLQEDIEHYGKCPYCDTILPITSDLEEFLLNPVSDHWNLPYGSLVPDSIANSAGNGAGQ